MIDQDKFRADKGAKFFGRFERHGAGWRGVGYAVASGVGTNATEEPEYFDAVTREEVATWLTQTALLRGFRTWHEAQPISSRRSRDG